MNSTVKEACLNAYNNPLPTPPGRYKTYISIEGTWYFYNPETNKIHVEAYTEDNMEPISYLLIYRLIFMVTPMYRD